MNRFLSTTALVIAMGLPSVTLAQVTTDETTAETTTETSATSGFLSERAQTDIFVSELMGMDVYAQASTSGTETDTAADLSSENTDDMATAPDDGTATTTGGTMDDLEVIGQINEVILSADGEVRALVIGVGGFLGMGEQDVAMGMDKLDFTTSPDDMGELIIIADTNADELGQTPAFDRTTTGAGDRSDLEAEGQGGQVTETQDGMPTDAENDGTDATDPDAMPMDGQPGMQADDTERGAFAAPDIERDGYGRMEVGSVSSDTLVGQSVYDINDTDVGTVEELILGEGGEVMDVIIDFGGFLGIGSRQAALSYDELTILTTEANDDVRVYVDATEEQIQNLPEYESAN
ncbi:MULTISPECIES: PRC-barrel domain-containing protein [unclassified Yoonia]|uniref:PRC-barrel domain-containing protein n=1 Tax=unclassified Yoonia TaxID=2629118 RepID=UPI002AFE2D80|nr:MULTISPECIES: PRC-barrel domain-containing protein [unclassified Yoonia]